MKNESFVSSQEYAKQSGRYHSSVCGSAENAIRALGLNVRDYEAPYIGASGKVLRAFNITLEVALQMAEIYKTGYVDKTYSVQFPCGAVVTASGAQNRGVTQPPEPAIEARNVTEISVIEESINGGLTQTVNARELHAFLESKQRFSDWIKSRVDQYGFIEGVDFIINLGQSSGGRPSIDYYVTLDMAKELSMVERNEKGKQARRYFIECERVAKSAAPKATINNAKIEAELAIAEKVAHMLRLPDSGKIQMISSITTNNGLDASFLPAYAIDAPSDSAGGSSLPTQPITALLKNNGIGVSAVRYNELLRDAGMLERLTIGARGEGRGYWSITDLGLTYGKNLTSPQNPRATQPHWYVSRFDDLHEKVVEASGVAV